MASACTGGEPSQVARAGDSPSASRTAAGQSEAGCGTLRELPTGDRTHLAPGERFSHPSYPPLGGRHDANTLQAGWYEQAWRDAPAGSTEASLVKAVHSLEHGYVAVLYRPGAELDVLRDLWSRSEERHKLLIAPASGPMERSYALVAWERVRYCDALSLVDALEFVHAYREATSAPEPKAD